MDLEYTVEQDAFRDEVREFIHENLDEATKHKVESGLKLEKHDYVNWQKALNRKGWLAPHWPVAHGGTGWTPVQQYIFEEEAARGCAPPHHRRSASTWSGR